MIFSLDWRIWDTILPCQGVPLEVINSTSVLTLLCTFIMCFVKVTIEISLIDLYFTSFHWITMVKDYINGYIVSIWVIFEWYLMYILSLNCKILLMCCILNLRVPVILPCKDFYTPVFPRNCFGVLVRGYPGKGVLSARKKRLYALLPCVLFK